MRTMIAGLLASAAILRMPDGQSLSGDANAAMPAPAPDAALDGTRIDRLRDAVNKLDDANDSHWNVDGTAAMLAVEGFFGDNTPTRAEVDAIGRVRELKEKPTDSNATRELEAQKASMTGDMEKKLAAMASGGAGSTSTEPSKAPIPPATVTPGRIVTITFDPKPDNEGKPTFSFDGELVAAAVVTKVYDDGTINVRAFAPNGGNDGFFTGVRHKADVDAMPDGADKNAARAAVWDWPTRA